jgi:hypothetical protein
MVGKASYFRGLRDGRLGMEGLDSAKNAMGVGYAARVAGGGFWLRAWGECNKKSHFAHSYIKFLL